MMYGFILFCVYCLINGVNFRFDSPAGNLIPTECPGGNYCGTQLPVWMKGRI